MAVRLAALLILAALGQTGCTPTGPPASGANSSAPEAVDQATHGLSVGGSNDFTPGHTP
jgi:hypothetical protein